jgi:hypothetical protein
MDSFNNSKSRSHLFILPEPLAPSPLSFEKAAFTRVIRSPIKYNTTKAKETNKNKNIKPLKLLSLLKIKNRFIKVKGMDDIEIVAI